jgi:hypothetical protein
MWTGAIWIYGLNVAGIAVSLALSILFGFAVGGVVLWLCLGAGQPQSNQYPPVPGTALLFADLGGRSYDRRPAPTEIGWLLLRYLEVLADKPAPKNAGASLEDWARKFSKGKAP